MSYQRQEIATPQAIVTEARKYLGVPYKFGGRDTQTGLDCVGLLLLVARPLGLLRDVDVPEYGRVMDPTVAFPLLRRVMDEIPVRQARTGDVCIIGLRGTPQGVVIISNDNPRTIIHVDNFHVLEEPFTIPAWYAGPLTVGDVTLAAFRFRGLVASTNG